MHVGAPKTGTTFLQAVLFHNVDVLRDQGVLVPGRSRIDHGLAATGLRQGPQGRRWQAWRRLVAEVADWPGPVVISNEWFALASAEAATRGLSDLADAEVVLIFTARDLVEQVPAAWQETLKLGESSSLQNFIKALDVDEGRWRWSVLDPAEALPKWRAGLPADHIHVVTSPPKRSGDSPLWPRFASVCGIDPQSCETDLGQSRESLGVESARLLQLIGPDLRTAVHADEPGQWKQAYEWIQRVLSHELLAPLGGNRIGLDERDLADIRERSARSVQSLADAGYNVLGSLDDLVSAAVVDTGRAPEDVSDTELLALTLKLVPGLLGRLRDATRAAGPQPPEPPGEKDL